MAQIAREPLCNTPNVASQRELTRFACRSCSRTLLRVSWIALNGSLSDDHNTPRIAGERQTRPSGPQGIAPTTSASIFQFQGGHDAFRNRPGYAKIFYVALHLRGRLRWRSPLPSRTSRCMAQF